MESLATLPDDVMVEYSLIVQFGQFGEQLLGGSDTPGSGTAVGLAEWSWFFPPIDAAGGQGSTAALGAAGEIAEGTALVRTGVDAFVVEFAALPTFEDATVFAVDVVATFSSDGEVLNTCSDTVILPGVR